MGLLHDRQPQTLLYMSKLCQGVLYAPIMYIRFLRADSKDFHAYDVVCIDREELVTAHEIAVLSSVGKKKGGKSLVPTEAMRCRHGAGIHGPDRESE